MQTIRIQSIGMMLVALMVVPAVTAQQSNLTPETAGQVLALQNLMPEVENVINQEMQETVSGTVVDAQSGESLPGVNIILEGTTTGTSTGPDGYFELEVPSLQEILIVSYIGYVTKEVPIDGTTTIDVNLEPAAVDLDELVVIGYGTQRKATLTGSVTSVGSREITSAPTQNLSASLAGLLPGVIAMNRSGQPGGDDASILIRGNTTTGNNAPLVLVDGVPEDGWQRINSNDIESISVLKDAAASIYGVQAANGVILITTKRGATGKPTFNFSYNQGIHQPTRMPEVASSATLAENANEWLIRTGVEPRWTEEEIQKFRDGSDPLRYPNTDWVGKMIKPFALQETANLNMRGGVENLRFSVSASYQHKDDVIRDGIHDFKSYSVRTNLDADISEHITLSLDLNAGQDNRVEPNLSSWYYLFAVNPQIPFEYPGGFLSDPPSDYGNHPAITNTGGSGYNNQDQKRFTGRLTYDIVLPWLDGLGIDGYFNYRNTYNTRKQWMTPWTYYGWNHDTNEPIPFGGGTVADPTLDQRFNENNATLINIRFKYEKQFNSHNVNAFVAAEQSEGFGENIRVFRRDFYSQAIDEIFAGSAAGMATDGSSFQNARQNVFGRFSYNFQEKYLLDFNFRYDGSYRFPPGSRWGFFPGVSVAYRMTQENFMENVDFLDELKFRASYGQMGNDAISPFQFLQSYNLHSIGYHFGAPQLSTPQPRITSGVNPNPNVTWEVATLQNVGVDVIILNELLGFSVDLFQQRRTNILTTRALEVPDYTGLNLPSENIGQVDNRGVEFEVTHRNNLAGGDFTYNMSGNIAFARNNVVDVSEATDVPDYQKAEGSILGAPLLYEAIGIFRTQEEVDSNPILPGTVVGDLQYRDIDGDGIISGSDRVRTNKSIIPEITFGYNLNVGYKNFGLFAHFAGQANAWWYIHQNARPDLNAPAELLENRYTPGSMDSKYPWVPHFSSAIEVSGLESTFWLQNASFLRLKTLELSYNVPSEFLSRLNVSNVRIFANGSNLFTISEIKWFDPEGSNTRGNFYPQSRIFNLGVQLTF